MKTINMIPDLILYNGVIYTQDPENAKVEAIAIGGGKILAVGDNQFIRSLGSKNTRYHDLEGRTGLPGMIDSHFHYHEWAFMRHQVNLAEVSSFAECTALLEHTAEQKPKGDWILGQGFNESDWPENKMPLKADLDQISTEHPIIIWRCDLHLAVANSLALRIAGIGRDTPNPPEGVLERDSDGNLTGILRELAINLVKVTILPLMDDSIEQAMQEGMNVLNALGLTAIHDVRLMGGLEGASALKTWQKLEKSANLTLRTWVSLPGENLDEVITLGLKSGFGNDKLRLGHVKFFADGGMGARTAYMIDPYLDAEYGMHLTPVEELEKALCKANQNELSVMIHSIGDRMNRELIDIFTKHPSVNIEIPHRIEHLQMIRIEDIRRLAKLSTVVACVQPHNLLLDINMIDHCMGKKGKYAYAFRDMLDEGVSVIFSSDCPVGDPSPLVGIHAAVTRQRSDGTPKEGWYPQQKVSVAEAVNAYTLAPAIAAGAGDVLGSITPGKYADLVVLDQDIYSIDPSDILNTEVQLTLFDGQIVHQI